MPPTRATHGGVSAENIIEGSRKRARGDHESSPRPAPSSSLTSAPGSSQSDAPASRTGEPASSGSHGGGGDHVNDRERAAYKGFKLLDAVIHKHDSSDGQPLAIPFLALPSKKDYPDYYEIVKTPLSIEMVRRRLVERDFETFDQVRHALEGICRNAKRYNANGSEIFEKARQLHSYIRDAYADLVEKGEVAKLSADDVTQSTPPLQQQSEELAKAERTDARARLDFDEDGVSAPTIDLRLKRADDIGYMEDGEDPGGAEEEEEDEQDETEIAETSAGRSVAATSTTSQTTVPDNLDGAQADAPPVPIKRPRGRPRGSRGRKFMTGNAPTRITLKRGPSTSMDTMQMVLRRELEKIKALHDEDGDEICEAFLELPSKRSYPDYYQLIKKPISLEEIETSIEGGSYRSAFDFVADVQTMVDNAQFYNEDGSVIWKSAEQIKRHLESVTVPTLKTSGFGAVQAPSAVKDEFSSGEHSTESSRLKVRLASRGGSASASPALESKDAPPSAMGPPAMTRQGSNGLRAGSASSPHQQPAMLPTNGPMMPSHSSAAMHAAQMTPAQHLRPSPPFPGQQGRPPMMSPSVGPGHMSGQPGARPTSMSPNLGASHSPSMQHGQARPSYPGRPVQHQQSPSPGPNGQVPFHGRPSPQYAGRPGMPGQSRPFASATPGQSQSPHPGGPGRPPRRLPGDGPFDPLSSLKMAADDDEVVWRTPVVGKFIVRSASPTGKPCETVLSNKLARVHSVAIDSPASTIEIEFRVRGVVQRFGEREEIFTNAPDWKVQVQLDGHGLNQLTYKQDPLYAQPAANGTTAHDDGSSGAAAAESQDRTRRGDAEAVAVQVAGSPDGVFLVKPFSVCTISFPAMPGLHIVDIAISYPPPHARLIELTQSPPDAGVSEHVRMNARSLLGVPERYRIFLQSQAR